MAETKLSKAEAQLLNEEARQRASRHVRKKLEEEEKSKPPAELSGRFASEIKPEKLKKIFGGRLLVGQLNIIFGPGEVGKGVFMVDTVSRLTTGEPFPGENGARREPINVMIVTVEDSVGRVTARLLAAGADLDRVMFIDGPPEFRGGLLMPHTPVMLDSDAGGLLRLAQKHNMKGLFLETMVEHLGDRDGKMRFSTNNDSEVRRSLSPFRAICEQGDLIGVGIMHPRKGTDGSVDEAIGGSIAFRNVARSTLGIYMDPSEDNTEKWRLLPSGKANHLPNRPKTLRFRIDSWSQDTDEPRLVYGVEGRSLEDDRYIDDIWEDIRERGKRVRKRKDHAVIGAEAFLSKFLADEMKTSQEVYAEGLLLGHSEPTLDRAKKNLGIESVKGGFESGSKWLWRLPKEEV